MECLERNRIKKINKTNGEHTQKKTKMKEEDYKKAHKKWLNNS